MGIRVRVNGDETYFRPVPGYRAVKLVLQDTSGNTEELRFARPDLVHVEVHVETNERRGSRANHDPG